MRHSTDAHFDRLFASYETVHGRVSREDRDAFLVCALLGLPPDQRTQFAGPGFESVLKRVYTRAGLSLDAEVETATTGLTKYFATRARLPHLGAVLLGTASTPSEGPNTELAARRVIGSDSTAHVAPRATTGPRLAGSPLGTLVMNRSSSTQRRSGLDPARREK